jgi:hypothetical protein
MVRPPARLKAGNDQQGLTRDGRIERSVRMSQAIKAPYEAKAWTPLSGANDGEMPFPWPDTEEPAGSDTAPSRVRVSVAVVIEVFLRDGSLDGRYLSAAQDWWPQ